MFKVPISRGLFQGQKGLVPSPRWKRAKIGTFGCPVTNGRVQNICIVATFHLLFQASFEGNHPGLKAACKKEQNQNILGTLPKTNSSPLNVNSWKMTFPFGPGLCLGLDTRGIRYPYDKKSHIHTCAHFY